MICLGGVLLQVKGLAGLLQLAMQVLPLTNPQVVKVLALAHPPEGTA